MARIETLFELVKSLDKGQKRQFKLQSGIHDGSNKKNKNYTKLFDFFDDHEEFELELFLTKYPEYSNKAKLHNDSKYLYKFILKTLNYYYNGVYAEVTNLLRLIDILKRQKMYDEVKRMIPRAKKRAMAQENFTILKDLLMMEYDMLEYAANLKTYQRDLARIREEQKQANELEINIQEYQNLYSEIRFFIKTRRQAIGPEAIAESNYIREHLLMSNADKALSITSKIHFYNIRYNDSSLQNNFEECLHYGKVTLEIYESNPEIREVAFEKYLNKISQVMILLLRTKRWSEAEEYYKQLKESKSIYGDYKDKIFENTSTAFLLHYIESGNLEYGENLIADMVPFMEKTNVFLSIERELSWYYYFAYFFFSAGEFQEASKWSSKILSMPGNANTGIYFQNMARILDLLILLEQSKNEILADKVRSLRRFLQRGNQLFKGEPYILKYLNKLSNAANKQEQKEIFLQLRSGLEQLHQDPNENRINTFFDFPGWIAGKLSDRTLMQIKRESRRD